MSEKSLHELRDLLCREVDEMARHQDLTQSMLDNAQKVTSTIKNIDKILMAEQYSERSGSYNGGSYNGNGSYDGSDGSYDGGYSSRRYRDSNGRFASYGRMTDRSWGEAKETMIQQLSDMLSMANNAREKEIVRRARDELKEM